MGRVRAGAIPGGVGDVTPAWLTRALQPCAEGVVVSRVDADGLGSGTTQRARLMLRFEGPGRRADLPDAMFVKLAPRDLRTRLFVGLLGLGRSEVAFYRRRAWLLVRAAGHFAPRRGARDALRAAARGSVAALPLRGHRLLSDPLRRARRDAGARQLHAAFWRACACTDDLAWRGSPRDHVPVGGSSLDLSLRPAFDASASWSEPSFRAAGFVSGHRLALEALWARPRSR
jgi:hypothetical protein